MELSGYDLGSAESVSLCVYTVFLPVYVLLLVYSSVICICLCIDYVSGGEMFTHLYQRDHFSEEEVRIYIGEIILALEHLHKVCYRAFLSFTLLGRYSILFTSYMLILHNYVKARFYLLSVNCMLSCVCNFLFGMIRTAGHRVPGHQVREHPLGQRGTFSADRFWAQQRVPGGGGMTKRKTFFH